MTDKLKKQAERLGISDFGVVKARVFDDLCLALREKGGFSEEEITKKCNPFLIMPDAKSIVVCIFSYNTPQEGNISKYAMGKDYHSVLHSRLEKFSEPLVQGGYKCEFFSDSWDLDERYLAVKAGLGFIGKNHMFISPLSGSFVFIGAVLTDCALEESQPLEMTCMGCGKCIKSCWGGALGSDGGFDEKKCLSYITQKKGELSTEEKELILKGGKIWGCDRCQEVCPHNVGAPYTKISEFSEKLITDLKVDESLSNRGFRRAYSDRAFSWRGISPLIRNQRLFRERKNYD